MNKIVILLLFLTNILVAQNVGINTDSPQTSLDIHGAIRIAPVELTVTGASIELPKNHSNINLIGTPSTVFTIFSNSPIEGQQLFISNNTSQSGSLSPTGLTIPAGKAMEFIYQGSIWRKIGSTENLYVNHDFNFISPIDLPYPKPIIQAAYKTPLDFPMLSFSSIGALAELSKSNILNIKSTGEIGVNTINPIGKFEVNHRSKSYNPSIVITDSSNVNTEGGMIEFRNLDNTKNFGIQALLTNSIDPDVSYLNFRSDGNYLMRLTSGGNLGIGSLSPLTAGLVVNKNVFNTHAVFGSNTSGVSIESQNPGIHFNSYKNKLGFRYTMTNGYTGGIDLNPTNGDMSFYTLNSNFSAGAPFTYTSRMILDNEGNLKLKGNKTLELGSDIAGKETNAGKIGYATFTPSTLDIIGAGTNPGDRKIKLWAEGGLTVDGSAKVNGSADITAKVTNTSKTGNANLVPLAYGTINGDDGSIRSGSNNFTVSKYTVGSLQGAYQIIINGETYSNNVHTVLLTIHDTFGPVIGSVIPNSFFAPGFLVRTDVLSPSIQPHDSDFSFIVYKP
jgi:hypothetical protein